MQKKKYWEDSEFITVVNNSISVVEVLKVFNLPGHQPHYRKLFFESVLRLNLSLEHFSHKYTIEDMRRSCQKSTSPNSSRLKEKLINKKILEYKCAGEGCGLSSWLGKSISLDMDHIDGNRSNNDISNLRFLCPNCHAQTDTYRNKNVKNRNIKKETNSCPPCKLCGKTDIKHNPQRTLRLTSGLCRRCYIDTGYAYKIDWPPVEDLIKELEKGGGFEKLGRQLKVTANMIRKRIRKYGYDPKVYSSRKLNPA